MSTPHPPSPAPPDLNELKGYMQDTFGHSPDFSVMPLRIGDRRGLIGYLNTMTEADFVSKNVIQPLVVANLDADVSLSRSSLDGLKEQVWAGLSGGKVETREELVRKIVCGNAGVAVEGFPGFLALNIQQLSTRSVEEPSTQTVIRGPKEGFTESAHTNMSLVRRRLRNEHLRFESYTVGDESGTDVYLAYLEGEIDPQVLRKIQARLKRVKVDGLFDSGSLEELLRPQGFPLLPTVLSSERPDTICAYLMEGRAAIIVNGSPFVLAVPAVLNDFLKSPEDHYQWFVFGTFSRCLRYAALMITLFLSSMYVAVTNYHQELVPTVLLTSIAAQREGIPFPTVVEVLLMEIVFELLREAGIRMPRVVGQAISIVGALVLGQAAVEAGIVSNILVIVVAMSAISGFVVPVYAFGAHIRLLRFGAILMAFLLGLYGVVLSAAFLLIHLLRLQSFGIPYLSPFAPFRSRGQKDAMFRARNPIRRGRRS